MDELISALLRAFTQAELNAVRAIPDGMAPHLTEPVTAVGLESAKGLESGLYNYLGLRVYEGELRPLYGKRLQAALLLTVCCPRRLGAARCAQEADAVTAMLLEGVPGVRITGFTEEGCVYEEKSDCFCCRMTAQAEGYLYAVADEDETEFTDFILKGAANGQ